MIAARVLDSARLRLAWVAVGLLCVGIGVRYIATEPLILEPGGWFALDGQRVLDAAESWRSGQSPYSIEGFLYSPVAVALALPFVGPYAGIHAALPIPLALPSIAASVPVLAPAIVLVSVVTALWSPIVATLVVIGAATIIGGRGLAAPRLQGRELRAQPEALT